MYWSVSRPGFLLVVLFLLGPAEAFAQSAQEHFERGEVLQREQKYAEAIAAYEQAYALEPLPDLLFNIAQCHRLNGDQPAALDFYRRFLAARPSGPGSDEARRHVQAMEAEPPPAAQPEPPVVEREPPVIQAPAIVPPPAPREQAGFFTRDRLRWSGVGFAAVGAVAAGLGGYYAYETERLEDEVSAAKDWSDAYEQLLDDGEEAERRQKICFAIGGGLAAIGAALFATSFVVDEPRQPAIGFVPSLAPGSLGAVLHGRF